MRNSADAIDEIKEIKNISGRRSIREGGGGGGGEDNFIYDETLVSRKKAINNNEDRSISEPPQSRYNNHTSDSVRLKTIREKMDDDNQCSSDDEDFSKSNSHLNGSDLDLEIPESASQTPTPTPLMVSSARRINSETNLNDSKRRLTGFMGNRSKRFCASTSELSFSSHLDTNKSLFSPKNNRGSRTGSLYGSNMSLNSSNNSRLFMVNSPFYNGKTTFGGASAYPRKDINQHKILRNPVQMRPSSSLSNSSNTSTKSEGAGYMPESNAAKRILEIMTQFNGPLKETRSMGNNINSMMKIPGLVQNRKRFGEEDLQLNRSIALSRPTAPYSRPIAGGAAASAPKNTPESIASSLLNTSSTSPQVPTMSQLLKMKRLQNNTERAREIANRSENFLNQMHEYKLPSSNDETESRKGGSMPENNTNSSSSLKMKNNITKNLLRNDKVVIDQPPEPLNLPNIQLPELKSYPKFDIKGFSSVASVEYKTCFKVNSNSSTIAPSSQSLLSTTTITSAKASSIESPSEKTSSPFKSITTNSTTVMDNFKFSMPIMFDAGAIATSRASTTDKFVFSRPQKLDEKENVNTNVSSDTFKLHPSTAAPPPATDNLFKGLVAKQNSQWECDSCLTRNENEKTKCLCCDTVRPGSETKTVKPKESFTSVIPSLPSDDLFKKLAAQQKKSQWECDACMTKNDLDKDKCLCCETPKPGSKPASVPANSSLLSSSLSGGFKFGMPSSSNTNAAAAAVASPTGPIKPSDDLFKSLAAQQKKSQWECDACMTRNDSDKDRCACCETPKPGSSTASKPQNSSLTSSSSFSFGIKPAAIESGAKFSFGMPSAAATATTTTTTTSSPKSIEDPGFKKILEKQNLNWECSACMTRNEQSQSKCICCEQVKPGSSQNQAPFSFASKSLSSVSLPPPTEVKFSFGVQSTTTLLADVKNSDSANEQKKDEVDKSVSTNFSFGSSTPATAAGLKFGNTSTTETKPVGNELVQATSFTFKTPANNAISTSFTIPTPKADEKTKSTDEKDAAEKQLKGVDVKTNSDKKVTFNTEASKETSERPGGFSFSSTTSSTPSFAAPGIFGSSAASTTAATTNGGVTFGTFSKASDEAKTEVAVNASPKTIGAFQATSTTTSSPANASGFGFGAKTVVSSASETAPSISSASIFSFGAQKTESASGEAPKAIFGTFGSNASTSTATISAFSPAVASTTQAAPVFGSSSFVFGNAKKDENTAPSQASSGFSFSSKPTSSNMVFGSNQSTAPSMTPVFGSANSISTFGSNISNNATSTNNNNESGFGSKMNSFGGIQASAATNQPQKRSFDFGSAVNSTQDGSQSKKFDFGSQQPQAANTAPPFAFNAQSEHKPAFNFGTSTPTFNFTANNNPVNSNPVVGNAQENLFQFGANNPSATTQGIFAFGANPQPPQQQQPATAPPVMSFGAAAPSVALGGINAAFNPGTGSASPQRKILRAQRRQIRR